MFPSKSHARFMESGHPARTDKRAFSLVEVTMALGIVAFTIIPLFALLTVGLNSNRGNIDRSINTQILNWVHGDVRWQSAPYSADFDEFGIMATNLASVYRADITPRAIFLPGGSLAVPAWDVVITHRASENRKLEEKIVWGSP